MTASGYAMIAQVRFRELRTRIGLAAFIAVTTWFLTHTFWPAVWFGAVVATQGLDWGTRPLRNHADAFMIAVTAAFFVALFAVGGSYLTPELKTTSELVSWAQLIIALLVVPRRTRAVAARPGHHDRARVRLDAARDHPRRLRAG